MEADLNTKISEEEYNILKKEFGSDRHQKKAPEEVAAKKTEEKKTESAVSTSSGEIKTVLPDQPRIKTVGKVDLNNLSAKTETATSAPEKTVQKPTPKAGNTASQQVAQAEKKEAKPLVQPAASAKPTVAPPTKPVGEVKVKPTDKPASQNALGASQTANKENIFRPSKPQVIEGPKVMGTIDLDSINENMRPTKKSKEERKKEREEKRQHTKKRNRIQTNKVDIKTEANAIGKDPQPAQRKDKNKRNKNKGKNQGGTNQQNATLKPAVSEEEVAKQVKKTLERLQGKKAFASGAKYRRDKREQIRDKMEQQLNEEANESKILKLTEFVTANELASMMKVSVNEVISTCMSIGMMISINQRMDAETINMVAEEFGFKTEYVSASVSEAVQEEEDQIEDL
ncbi:MAG: translation initiation factor IF-2 N-terminal domain-containing protein, partial [Bacteroidaceae bacterium]